MPGDNGRVDAVEVQRELYSRVLSAVGFGLPAVFPMKRLDFPDPARPEVPPPAEQEDAQLALPFEGTVEMLKHLLGAEVIDPPEEETP